MDRPEVNPVVTNMPIQGNRLHSGGSARTRVIKPLKITESSFEFDVSGVPGHTHNASAVVSVTADYTKQRDTAINIAENAWAPGALVIPNNVTTDSVLPADFEERADRAIERGIGTIAMTPENCHSFISEPTRSISEIRTLVSPADQLDTLTYVEEESGWQVVAAGNVLTPLISNFPDIVVDILPLSHFQEECTFQGVGAVPAVYVIREDATTFDGVGAMTAASDGSGTISVAFDGCLEFVWDNDTSQYVSKQVTFTPTCVTRVVGPVTTRYTAKANAGAGAVATLQPEITISIPPIRTTVAKNGYCLLCDDDVQNPLLVANKISIGNINPKIPIQVFGISDDRNFVMTSCAAYRFPVGGKTAIPSELKTQLTLNNVTQDFWSYATKAHQKSKIMQDLHDSSLNPPRTTRQRGLGTI